MFAFLLSISLGSIFAPAEHSAGVATGHNADGMFGLPP